MLDTTEIRSLLQEAGGLVTVAMLAERWGMLSASAKLVTEGRDFPIPMDSLPFAYGPEYVWLLQAVQEWEDEYKTPEAFETS